MTKCAHALSPRAPGCPCSHRGLCTQPAPAGARGKDGLSQLEEDICIKLIKKKKQNPKTKPNPNRVRVQDALPSLPALPSECVRDTLAQQMLGLGGAAGQSQRCRFHLHPSEGLGAFGTVPSATGTSPAVSLS